MNRGQSGRKEHLLILARSSAGTSPISSLISISIPTYSLSLEVKIMMRRHQLCIFTNCYVCM